METRERLAVSLGAVLAALCLYYRGLWRLIPALLCAAAAHESAHLLALRLLGLRVESLRIEPGGLCIRYSGVCSPLGHAAAALAGPMGGFLYAAAINAFPEKAESPWLLLSAEASLFLSLFNLLPILPLDGGRVFQNVCARALGEERGLRLFEGVSRALLAIALCAGVLTAAWRKAGAPLAAALWLLLLQKEPLVKKREVL